MGLTGSVREALIAEAIGDLARLIDRIETLAPQMQQAQSELLRVRAELTGHSNAFRSELATVVDDAKTKTVVYFLRQADQAARDAFDLQRKAMAETAAAIFSAEMVRCRQELLLPLKQIVEDGQPKRLWMAYALMALLASIGTTTVAALLWLR